MTTPHQRRVLELEAMRQLIGDLESMIRASKGTLPTADVAAAVERATAPLPESSAVREQLQSLGARLRAERSAHLAESGVRKVAASLRQHADDLGRWVDAREQRLSAKHGGRPTGQG